jgi:3-dehydroquinate synthase
MTIVPVTASKNYDVCIGSGLLSECGDKIAEVCGIGSHSKAVLVTDDVVNQLYGEFAENSLYAAGYAVTRFVFPNGEQSKHMGTYIKLLEHLTETNLTRTDVIIALGGGVVGDLTGFAAATYLRGVRFVQIPTTLLAMVDSSVGGKTGVNLKAGKNQAGAFYQPEIVICDYDTLKTLPDDIFKDGCAEVIKHAVIRDAELFDLLVKTPFGLDNPQNTENVIARNVTIKRDVVALDERDTGIRQVLNFGHTIGHGIEKHSDYSVSHGKAVAIGMVIASRGAWKLGFCSEECHRKITAIVKQYGLPHETQITPEQLISAAFADKKRSGDEITLIIPEKIGHCELRKFYMDELAQFITLGMNTG